MDSERPTLFPRRDPTGNWIKDHSLSLVIAAILAVQFAIAIWTGFNEWSSQQADHSGQASFSDPEFWIFLAYETNMSTLADTYGVLLIVLLSKWFYERGSAESK